MNTRAGVLLAILCVVSVLANLHIAKFQNYIWPTELRYRYSQMFLGSALMYRPAGTEGLALLDMDEAVITVTEYGSPINCAVLTIHTSTGSIQGECVEGRVYE